MQSRHLIGVVVAWLALWPGLGHGQTSTSFTFHAGATSVTNGAVMSAANFSTIVVQVEGTFVGTVQFEKKTKNAAGYVAVQCTNAADRTLVESSTNVPGYWECPGGAYSFRVPVTARTSGTIIVTGMGTTAVASKGVGGSIAGVTLGQAATNGRVVTSATTATPVEIGNGTQAVEVGGDATLGGFIRPKPLGDSIWHIWTNFNGCIKDEEAVAFMLCYNPAAPTPREMMEYKVNYRPRGYFFIPAGALVGDGSNCPAAATAVTINGGPKVRTMICGSVANGDMDFGVVMPMDWDGTALVFEVSYTQTAANTSAMNSDIKAQCRGTGETPSSTWGTSANIDDAAVTGSGAEDRTLSGAVTPAGTCGAGDHLYVRYTVDVTGTTTPEATLNFYGIGVYYSKQYWGN